MVKNGHARGFAFTDQYKTCSGINDQVAATHCGLIAGNPANGSLPNNRRIGIIRSGSVVEHMMAVHYIQKINKSIACEIGIKRKANQAMGIPVCDFLRDICYRLSLFYIISASVPVAYIHSAGSFPYKQLLSVG